MAKRAIQVLREMQNKDLDGIKCLYCMDTKRCNVCNGVGKLPEPHGASIRPVDCYRCKGRKKCQYCSKDKRAL